MDNKKIAIIIFILLTASFAVLVGTVLTLSGSLTANIFKNTNIIATIDENTTDQNSNSQNCGNFNDIPATSADCRLTGIMRDRNIFTGDANGNFRPNDPVSRAELAKILVIALYGNGATIQDYKTLHGSELNFRDISNETNWSFPYIKIAKEKGLIKGYTDGTFRKDNLVSRAEFAKMIYSRLPDIQTKIDEAKSYVTNKWPDYAEILGLQNNQWYTDYLMMILYADSENSFLKDCGGKICPEKNITRIEIAGAIEKLNSLYDLTIGFGEQITAEEITAEVTSANCAKIGKLQNITATLAKLGINQNIIYNCSKK
jgi:hypothetical protein